MEGCKGPWVYTNISETDETTAPSSVVITCKGARQPLIIWPVIEGGPSVRTPSLRTPYKSHNEDPLCLSSSCYGRLCRGNGLSLVRAAVGGAWSGTWLPQQMSHRRFSILWNFVHLQCYCLFCVIGESPKTVWSNDLLLMISGGTWQQVWRFPSAPPQGKWSIALFPLTSMVCLYVRWVLQIGDRGHIWVTPLY